MGTRRLPKDLCRMCCVVQPRLHIPTIKHHKNTHDCTMNRLLQTSTILSIHLTPTPRPTLHNSSVHHHRPLMITSKGRHRDLDFNLTSIKQCQNFESHHSRHLASMPKAKDDAVTNYRASPQASINDVVPGETTATALDGQEEHHESQEEQFTNYQVAYGSKTTWELARTAFFFFIFRFHFVTENSEKIMSGMRKVLGKRLSHFFLKNLIYDQFVAGDTNEAVKKAVVRIQKEGIGPLIAVPIEDDVDTAAVSPTLSQEDKLDKNLHQILTCMALCLEVSGSDPMFQLRMTALMSPHLTKSLSLVCTTDNEGNNISMSVVGVLVQGMQGKGLNIPKTKEWENFSATDIAELQRALNRVQTINEKILQTDILAMVDAEYTYFNPAIRHMAYAMMEICSQQKPLVFYTYQAYLKSTHKYLKSDIALAKSRNISFGAKLVRGAYIVKERHLAQVGGYPDPVNDDFNATSTTYRNCLDELLAEAQLDQDRIRFIVASHNEDTIRYAIKRMSMLGLPLNSKSIIFGQLYGMADHVSYTLGKKGINVVKSLPYGTVEDTIPYLTRRAQENRSIFDNVRKERHLVKKALRERMFSKKRTIT